MGNSSDTSSETIATGGLYLIQAVRALQSGDTDAINTNLESGLQQFAQVGIVSPWIRTGDFSMEPPTVTENNGADVPQANQTRQYSSTELLAKAGAHLAHAIGALGQGDTTNLEKNLAFSQQQIQFLLP
jgi:hypothetical protein